MLILNKLVSKDTREGSRILGLTRFGGDDKNQTGPSLAPACGTGFRMWGAFVDVIAALLPA